MHVFGDCGQKPDGLGRHHCDVSQFGTNRINVLGFSIVEIRKISGHCSFRFSLCIF